MKKNAHTRRIQGAIMVYTLLASGCELLPGPNLAVRLPLKSEELEKPIKSKEGEIVFKQLRNQDESKTFVKPKSEKIPGTGRFVGGSTGPTGSSGSYDASGSASSATNESAGKYSLNFDDADLGEVSKIILSDMLGENYVLNPTVAGKVTLQTTRPLTKEELLPTLEMLLRMNDVALVKNNGIFRIEPNAKALAASGMPTVGMSGKSLMPGFQTKIIPLRYVGAADLVEILTPLLPDKAVVKSDPARNILMVSGSRTEIERILDIVQTFDVNFMAGMSFGLFPLENVDSAETITQLEGIFNKEDKSPLSGMIRFVPIKHLNSILVVTQQPEYLEEAKNWVARLDKPGTSAAEGGVVVYRVQHVDATELAATLTSIFTGTAAPKSTTPSTAPGSQATTLTNKPATTQQVQKKTSPTTGANANQDNEFQGVQVIADEANNALVITAKPQQYRLVKKLIQELDVMPLQVLIDATIIAVKLTDKLEYGIKYFFENHASGQDYSGLGGFQGVTSGQIIAGLAAASSGGFSYGFLDANGNARMAINMLAQNSKIDVLSSPSVMVLNNKEAKFHVGDTIPVQTGTSLQTGGVTNNALTGTGGLLSQNSQVKTGVDLEIKPRVNANGIVIMEVTQKVDNAKNATIAGGGINLTPTILQREIKSSVAVVSGETLVLGGLISEEDSDVKDGIPLLKDIPWVGSLFSSTAKNKTRDELVILITPKVVENKYDARKVAYEFKQRLPGIFYDDMPRRKASTIPAREQ